MFRELSSSRVRFYHQFDADAISLRSDVYAAACEVCCSRCGPGVDAEQFREFYWFNAVRWWGCSARSGLSAGLCDEAAAVASIVVRRAHHQKARTS